MTQYDLLLAEQGVDRSVKNSESHYLLSRVVPDLLLQELEGSHNNSLLAQALEGLALLSADSGERLSLYIRAFTLRRSATLDHNREGLLRAAHLAAVGVLANRSAEVLMLLRDYQLPEAETLISDSSPFSERLLVKTVRAFILLVRRSGGWNDVRAAAQEIIQLRSEHQQYTDENEASSRVDDAATNAVQLVSGFNLAKIVDLAATFTASGHPPNVHVQFERFANNRKELSRFASDSGAGLLGDLIEAACGHIIQASIWTGTTRLGKSLRDFVSSLASPHRKDPLLELWPSQRIALDSHLLDPARRAVVVEMPTSAGKTLIAEFSIVQARALNPESTVVYVVPTRALVNQITQRLRKDLGAVGLVVESAVPVFELDPTEDILLREDIHVLVCTPEKLDLLVKAGHPSVANISLAVIDEAHNLSDGVRGARLELLLGMLKRERAETRFLLLTPFVPNASELANWLGDGTESTIAVDWRPSARVATTAHWKKPRMKPYELTLTTLSSIGNVDVESGLEVSIGDSRQEKVTSKAATTVALAGELAIRGGVLVLARGKGTAETRAKEIAASRRPVTDPSPLMRAVIQYSQDELGEDHLLPSVLSRGVAYHHAGLSHDLRYLIEQLIDDGDVNVVAGTTTLAQGLNFPISSVIVETLSKPQGFGEAWKDLTYSEFWNIAGRAGRAMRDPLGLVAFPCTDKAGRTAVTDFLNSSAVKVSSPLLAGTSSIDPSSQNFNLKFIRENPDVAVFLQYLTHVTKLGGTDETAAEIEDILRSSLVFHQARAEDSDLARSLVSVARNYVTSLAKTDRGFLARADGTGFSMASANLIYADARNTHPEFRASDFWTNENLFSGDSRSMTSIVEILGQLPELSLGLTSSPASFDPSRVAGIVRDWVSGNSMTEIANKWFNFDDRDPGERLRDASAYVHGKLIGQVPWGMGAMQKLLLNDKAVEQESSHAPSFVFYGVDSWEAVVMRMGGVPRSLAQTLGDRWAASGLQLGSFRQLRAWLSQQPADGWGPGSGAETKLAGPDAKLIWNTLSGEGSSSG